MKSTRPILPKHLTAICRIAIVVISILVLMACGIPSPEVTDRARSSPTSTVTPSAIATLTSRPSVTPKPTNTRTPSWTPTPSPTRFPTLEPEAKLSFITKMLSTNAGCELPCWWGVIPGKTKWNEMIEYFVSQGIDFQQEGQPDLTYWVEQKYRIETLDVRFQQENDLVQSVRIGAGHYYQYLASPEEFDKVWQGYALAPTLARYGSPDQVYLELTTGAGDWSPGMKQLYGLWLEYDDRGIAIHYPGVLIHDNQGWLVCPVFGVINGIEIRLQAPEAEVPLVQVESAEQGPFGFAGTLTELTGVSLQDFYEAFKQFPPHGCLIVADPSPWWYDELVLPSASIPLSAEHEDGLLMKMLSDNGGCELPCWWGIRPGDTSWQSAQRTFLSLGKSVSNRQTDDRGIYHVVSLFGRHEPYPFDYLVSHRFLERDGIVYLIGVTGYSLEWSPPQHFTRDWQHYSLDQTLARFGQPSQILLHYWNFGWQYSVGLVYEDRGILIQYVGPIVDDTPYEWETPIVFCPTQDRPTAISMWLTKPNTGIRIADAFAQFGYGYPDSHPFSSTPSLEEATGMSAKTFYETFLNPDTQTCLKVPRSLGDMAP